MWKKAIAEVMGTLFLVLIGTGAVVFGDSMLSIALAFGLIVIAMAYSIGTISGAHMNPGVSLAMFLNGRMNFKGFMVYVGAQLAGAVAGSAILRYFLIQSGKDATNLGATILAEGLTVSGGFIIELILTFLFVLVILTATGKNGDPHMAGLVIGLTLVAIILMGGTTTGISLNPARSFGPALLMGGTALSQLWLYFIAPLLGGSLAAFVAKYVLDTEAGAPGVEQEKDEAIT